MKAFVILILICIVLGAGYLLFLDYKNGQRSRPLIEQTQRPEVFGQTGMVENSVSLQSQGGLWTPLEVQNTIYVGDALRTAEGSMATVKVTDLTSLEINEKSLIDTEKSQTGLGIMIKVGEVSVKNSNPGFYVKNREALIQGVDGSDYKIVANDNGDTSLSFIKGKGGVVTDRDKKKVDANQGDEVDLKDGVFIQLHKSNATDLILPVDNARIDLKAGDNHVDFQWTTTVTYKFFLLELSETQDFKKILASHNIKEPKDAFKNLASNSYYWRVRVFDAKNQEISKSAIFSFNLTVPEKTGVLKPTPNEKMKQPAFEIISPKDQTEISRDLSVDSPEPILFQWKIGRTLPGLPSFIISTDPEFKETLKQDNLKKTSLSLRLKRAGFYYWKLYSESSDGKSQELSPVATFNLKTSTPTATPSPHPSATPKGEASPAPVTATPATSPVLKEAPTLNTPVVK